MLHQKYLCAKMSDPLSYSYSLTRTKMLPPPTPVVRKRSLLQRASSKLSSANRRSFGRWRSASLADLSNTSNNSKSSTTNDPFLVPNLSRCSSTEFRRPSLPTNEPQNLASIKRKSLRSSWRDLASEVSYDGDSLSNGYLFFKLSAVATYIFINMILFFYRRSKSRRAQIQSCP